MEAHAFSAQTIFERKPPRPFAGRCPTIEILEKRLSIVPREGHRHNLWKRHGLLSWNPFRARQRSPAGSERVAGFQKIVSNRTALDVGLGAPGTVRKHGASFEAVLSGIGIDQKSGDAEPFRGEGFKASVAVWIGISHERNFSADIDSVLTEVGIVLRISAVRVNKRCGHVT